jgi:hypothetical protein
MAAMLVCADQVEAFIRDLRAAAKTELSAGRAVPGWKLVANRPTSRWRDAAEAETMLNAVHNIAEAELWEPRKLVSPAVARGVLATRLYVGRKAAGVKVTKKGTEAEAKAALAPLVLTASSGFDIAPDTDARQAVALGAELTALPTPITEESCS